MLFADLSLSLLLHDFQTFPIFIDMLELHRNLALTVNESVDFNFIVISHAEAVFVHEVHPIRVELPTDLCHTILEISYTSRIMSVKVTNSLDGFLW